MSIDACISEIGMIGMSHKTAPVEVRECFVVPEDRLPDFFQQTGELGIDEIVYLSTCNRMEIYFAASDINGSLNAIYSLLERISGLDREKFEGYSYRKYSRDAVTHLLTVASSLDSMVLGENEIFCQVKKCYSRSVYARRTGTVLNKLFHQAFKTAKRVRTETEITKNPLSIAYIATELARKIFEDLAKRRSLLIGAGEMGELILKYLTKFGIGDITIANRSLHNAQRIAADINRDAHIIPLDDIASACADVDIIVASVSSPTFVITADMLKGALKKRGTRPLFIIDIAVPRNVDPDGGGLSNIFLYNIDDLKSIADENMKNRLREVDFAEKLIQADADDFLQWYEGLTAVPAIVKIQQKFDDIRRAELGKYRRRKLKHMSDEDFNVVEELTRQIMTKTLHNPIMYLKQYRKNGSGHVDNELAQETAKIIEELFKE